jgi:Tol biopolymer transport system component
VIDLARRYQQHLASLGSNVGPVWHPDGVQLGFTSLRKGDFDVFVARPDGGDAEGLLTGDTDEELVGWPNKPDRSDRPFVASCTAAAAHTPHVRIVRTVVDPASGKPARLLKIEDSGGAST